jgi:tRNA threonylcarbamoyladenosine biosynthesis protein TsaB
LTEFAMKILAIDTSTEACSAALLINGNCIERYQLAPREHNRLILPMVAALLAESGHSLPDLDALAFGCGPGSFTGLRIAAGVTQGLAFGADLPVLPVSTLAALALEAMEAAADTHAYPCIDARMSEVYWAVYQRVGEHEVRLLGEESVRSPTTVSLPAGITGIGVGSGWGTYADVLSARVGQGLTAYSADRFPRAAMIARLAAAAFMQGGGLPAEKAIPVYLRDNVALKSADRNGSGGGLIDTGETGL